MKRLIAVVGLGLALAGSGCVTMGTKYNFPQDIKGLAHDALNGAKACIESVDGGGLKSRDCSLTKVLGEKKIGGMWCWKRNGHWVGGLCSGNRVQIGCHPQTGQEIHFEALKHEFGHHWLMSNGIPGDHPARFSRLFYNWNSASSSSLFFAADVSEENRARILSETIRGMSAGSVLSVSGVDADGTGYCILYVSDGEE